MYLELLILVTTLIFISLVYWLRKKRASKMYGSMNWTCVCCDNMFMTTSFNFCSGNHVICSDCYDVIIPSEGCPRCHIQNMLRLEDNQRRRSLEETPGSSAGEGPPGAPFDGPLECKYKDEGCTYVPPEPWSLWRHTEGCKFRLYSCEGSTLGLWKCGWSGNYSEVQEHFQKEHPNNLDLLRSKTNVSMRLDVFREQGALQILKFDNELFYYKHKIDPKLGRLYVIVQMIGPEEKAYKYSYHYVIKKNSRTLSIREDCQSDGTPMSYLLNTEKCIVISLKNLRTYMDNDKLVFDIIIMFR
ncbi:putative E3 ubiquitin-protein ligase SINAT1 isoform X1 [Harmonia axyridis]|uniref:putative E3 ubiquitin-protein ligase SINAT1 isoform X1 n=1 Tax=Harmonia axyridis TaxID=115357 RepID=UPI001E276B72|nr:putative E3 ubiquitin-protein ligase SINAT1 isoform X1 [Harmonia axyridis]